MDHIPQYLQLPKAFKRKYLKNRIPIVHGTTLKSTIINRSQQDGTNVFRHIIISLNGLEFCLSNDDSRIIIRRNLLFCHRLVFRWVSRIIVVSWELDERLDCRN